jgi:hypothetical protein
VRGRLVAGAVLGVLLAGFGGLTAARPARRCRGVRRGHRRRRARPRSGARRRDPLADERTSGALPVVARDVRAALPRDLLEVDVEATVDAVLDDGGSPLTALLRRGPAVDLRVDVDRERLDGRLERLSAEVDREPFAGDLAVQGLTVTARPPSAGRALDAAAGRPRGERPRVGRRRTPSRCRSRTCPPGRPPRRSRRWPPRRAPPSPGRTSLGAAPARLTVTPQDVAPLLAMARVGDAPALTLDTAALRAVVAARSAPLTTRPRDAGFAVGGAAAVVDTKGDLVWTPRPAQVPSGPARPDARSTSTRRPPGCGRSC